MTAILVTYDVPKGKDSGALLEWIKAHDGIEMGQSSYVVASDALYAEVFHELTPLLPAGTKLLVVEMPSLFETTQNLNEEAARVRKVQAEAAERMGLLG